MQGRIEFILHQKNCFNLCNSKLMSMVQCSQTGPTEFDILLEGASRDGVLIQVWNQTVSHSKR